MTDTPYKQHKVLGVPINLLTIPELHGLIEQAVVTRQRLIVVSQNLHSIYKYYRVEHLRKMQELATYVRIDGMPLVWFARLRGIPARRKHRTGWMDWIEPFMTQAQQSGWRIHYVGSKPHVASRALEILRQRYPGLRIGGRHGYFDINRGSRDVSEVVSEVNASGADILMVGMGMPRQEQWVLENHADITVPVVLTCGACMDYVAGEQPIPPRWMGQVGLEWLHRLASDPKRMWYRYLVEPLFALQLLTRDILGMRLPEGRSE